MAEGAIVERDFRVFPPPKRQVLLPNEVLGTVTFIMTELMMFAGFISAFHIAKANMVVWPPINQPRLPIEATALNTAILIASGVMIWVAARRFADEPDKARTPLTISMAFGAFFVIFQGYEWVQLIGEGLTLTSTTHGSFFYVIVGLHAMHVSAGLAVLVYMARQLRAGELRSDVFWAGRLFWYFVVGLWPFLYVTVYL